ncbi:unnamed protein product [Calicophoron daubneyi]|uniref:tRNA-dihydrouridine(47) synthase [NAD(P)(+)] n=1 Tax=Calicophoron daubneyi TaxID=300641 RepID=A0AAV2TCP2_CALDB
MSGVARIKSEFLKRDESPPAMSDGSVRPNPADPAVPTRTRRKKEKIMTRNFGPEKVCPFILPPYPSASADLSCSQETDCHLVCPYADEGCRYSHDLKAAYDAKPPGLPGICPILSSTGRCPVGIMCRWEGSHNTAIIPKVIQTKNAYANSLNQANRSRLQKRQYPFDRSDSVIKLENKKTSMKDKATENSPDHSETGERRIGLVTDEDQIKLRPAEKRKIDFSNKLTLAPLTTVGNLPFRRICKRFGAEITCGEMAMATQLLQGRQSEWALLRKHSSEDIFGVQICGGHVDSMTKAAQLIDENCEVDFVDVNCGCPLDIVWKKGAGSGLLNHGNRLESIVRSMDKVLTRAVVTVKMRAGIKENKNIAHLLIPGLQRAGAALITIHGRSREQRYTRLSDWDYVKQCAEIGKAGTIFGNGDVLSYEDYIQRKEASGVAGIMIARGALIKPWIFTEIREARTWDISSNERFDILRDYTNYGLDLWGSDTRGVETTRRFLLEWLSFLYRYIPYGLLERGPQRINERPPTYFGRNDLETLMASEKSEDWIRISEMLLGPVPDGFSFTPRHKANSYH